MLERLFLEGRGDATRVKVIKIRRETHTKCTNITQNYEYGCKQGRRQVIAKRQSSGWGFYRYGVSVGPWLHVCWVNVCEVLCVDVGQRS